MLFAPGESACNVEVPKDADRRAAVAVVMGENSYIYIGKTAYSPGDTLGRPTGPVITEEQVRIESQIMVSVLVNRTKNGNFGGTTIAEVSAAPKQFEGYKTGVRLIDEALLSDAGSSLCKRLGLAVEEVNHVLDNPSAYNYSYLYWKATVYKEGGVNVVRPRYVDEFWVARTAFGMK